ncbi:unnamed protein product, partial [marine sediment metagenome]
MRRTSIPAGDRIRAAVRGKTEQYDRRFPLRYSKFQIGTLTVVMLVALRLTIGVHFFYEGVWKIRHSD